MDIDSLVRHLKKTRFIGMAMALMTVGLLGRSPTAAADEYLPAIGGPGGGNFEAHCPPGKLLAGFDLRAGDDVDAIRPVCVNATGKREVGPPGVENNWYGGGGGGHASVVCGQYDPVVMGMFVAYEGRDTVIVNNIHLFCNEATNTEPPKQSASAVFDAEEITGGGLITHFHQAGENTQRCPAGQVAVGVHGRYGVWVDAIGLICGASTVAIAPTPPPPTPVRSIGRVKTRKPQLETRSDRISNAATTPASIPAVNTPVLVPAPVPPRPPICKSAQDARARHSPAAPNLEAQCAAASGH